MIWQAGSIAVGRSPAGLATRWLSQALQGLHYAHHRGILHRDIKPHNLLLTSDWDVKISDFGLLKDSHESEKELTMHGTVMGTPQYISPEQALAGEVDERSDIYSLGASFFHILAGRPAFEERTTTATLIRITQHDMPALLDLAPQVPRPLAVIVDRMVALRPEDRYQDVRVILEDLNSYLQRGLLSIPAAGDAVDPSTAPDRPTDMTQIYLPNTATKPPWMTAAPAGLMRRKSPTDSSVLSFVPVRAKTRIFINSSDFFTVLGMLGFALG